MKILKLVLSIILGLFLIFGAYGHIASPEISGGFIPDFLPKTPVHILTAIVEAGLGVLTLIPKTRKYGLTGIFFLMIAFLPIHIIDLLSENPVIGSKTAAGIRLVMQFVLIFLAWFANRPSKT
jgi:uncharacterized membrane protein